MGWQKIAQKGLRYGVKKVGNTALKKVSDTYENIYNEIFGIKPLNKGEDETIDKMLSENNSMNKDINEWNDEDAMSVFHSKDYRYNKNKQSKFNEYLNFRGYKQEY